MSVGTALIILIVVILFASDEIRTLIKRMNAKLDRILERMGFDDGK